MVASALRKLSRPCRLNSSTPPPYASLVACCKGLRSQDHVDSRRICVCTDAETTYAGSLLGNGRVVADHDACGIEITPCADREIRIRQSHSRR
jgi:hypothetical protein